MNTQNLKTILISTLPEKWARLCVHRRWNVTSSLDDKKPLRMCVLMDAAPEEARPTWRPALPPSTRELLEKVREKR